MSLKKYLRKLLRNKNPRPTRNFPESVKKICWYNQDQKCNICKCDLDLRTVNYDHIKRHADGGTNKLDNCQALCPNCHAMKSFNDNRHHDADEAKPQLRLPAPGQSTEE